MTAASLLGNGDIDPDTVHTRKVKICVVDFAVWSRNLDHRQDHGKGTESRDVAMEESAENLVDGKSYK